MTSNLNKAPASARGGFAGNRRQKILEAAAGRFGHQGVAGTTIREIAVDSGVQPPAIYHYFDSKSDLLRAVHEEGMRRITGRVHSALVGVTDPWERLEAVCVAHMAELLEGGVFFRAVMRELPPVDDPWRPYIIALRDQYERVFVSLLADLRLPQGVDRHYLRLMLLGAMNWAFNWFRPDGESTETIARNFIACLRHQLAFRDLDDQSSPEREYLLSEDCP